VAATVDLECDLGRLYVHIDQNKAVAVLGYGFGFIQNPKPVEKFTKSHLRSSPVVQPCLPRDLGSQHDLVIGEAAMVGLEWVIPMRFELGARLDALVRAFERLFPPYFFS